MMRVVKSVLCLFLIGVLSISVAIPAMAEVEYREDLVKYKEDGSFSWWNSDKDKIFPDLKLKFMDFDTVEEEAISVDLEKGISKFEVSIIPLNRLYYFKLEIPEAGKIKVSTENYMNLGNFFVFKDEKEVKFWFNNVKKELEFNAKSSGSYYVVYRRSATGSKHDYLSLIPTFIPGDLTPLDAFDAEGGGMPKVINKTKTLKVNQSYTFSTKAMKKAKKVSVDYNNYCVSANEKGKITARKKGKATVWFVAGNYTYKITVTVK